MILSAKASSNEDVLPPPSLLVYTSLAGRFWPMTVNDEEDNRHQRHSRRCLRRADHLATPKNHAVKHPDERSRCALDRALWGDAKTAAIAAARPA